jgi:hypothetical protein
MVFSYSHQWWPISPQPSVVPPLMAPPNLSSNFLALGWSWHWMRSRLRIWKPSTSIKNQLPKTIQIQLHLDLLDLWIPTPRKHGLPEAETATTLTAWGPKTIIAWLAGRPLHAPASVLKDRLHVEKKETMEIHQQILNIPDFLFLIWRFSKIL